MKSNKTKKMKKRILALLLCMVMMLNGSVSALASEVANETKALSEDTHVHGEECYTRTKVSEELKCGKEVVEGHTHGDTCYEVTNTPECICTLEETEGHSHDDSCFETEEIQVCTLEEHEHGGGCYTTEKELTCGQEESEEHTHDDGCYKENVECICEIDEHSHGSDCYITDTKNICDQEEKEAHFHGDACYTAVENKTLTCQLEEIESHTHGDECYEWLEELVCEIEAEELVPEEISEETVIVCETCQKEKCECEKEVENRLIQTLGETTVELSGAEEAFEAEKTYALQVNELEEEVAVMVAAAIKDVTRTANLEVLDYQAFDITLTADEEATQPKAEVEVKFTGAKIEEYVATEYAEVKAFHVDAEGNAEEVNLTEGENEVSITTDHFSTYVVANVKTAEPVVLTTEVDGTTITLSGPVSAFAEGKTYEITAAKVEAEEELEVIEEALEEVAEEQEKVIEGYQAFDIKIIEKDETGTVTDENFQPLNETPVQVMFSGNEVAESVANEETEVAVYWIDGKNSATNMDAVSDGTNVAMETEHFSIYVVTEVSGHNVTYKEFALEVEQLESHGRLDFERFEIALDLILKMLNACDNELLTKEEYAELKDRVAVLVNDYCKNNPVAEAPDGTTAWEDFVNSGALDEDSDWMKFEGSDEEIEESMDEVQSEPVHQKLRMLRMGRSTQTSDKQVVSSGGKNVDEENSVSVSKTIKGTNLENVFDITLEVVTNEKISDVYKDPDVAIVVVMDLSNTMRYKYTNTTTTRYDAAMTAASNFLQLFADSTVKGGTSQVGMIGFNTSAHEIFALQECYNNSQVESLVSTMKANTGNIINQKDYASSNKRYTNIEGGLRRAQVMLNKSKCENKYILLLTDGFPTTYLKSGNTGYNPETSSGTVGAAGVFYDSVLKVYCGLGTSYSDTAAIKAREKAENIKNSGINIFSVGVDIGAQTIKKYVDQSVGLKETDNASVVERTSSTYEIGNASSAQSYKDWLGNKIGSGSGYYFDSNNATDLNNALKTIFAKVMSQIKQKSLTEWILTDPMPVGSKGEKVVEFIKFYNKSNTSMVDSLSGEFASGAENTATYTDDNTTINWDLKNSGYKTGRVDNVTTYTYTLVYRVRLKNEQSDFKEGTVYNTNNPTFLKYRVITEVDGVNVKSDVMQLNFEIPSVKGYLSELEFQKVDPDGNPVVGATFTLTHDTASCGYCRGDESKSVTIKDFTATSNAQGNVVFNNIPSGHIYKLKETGVPAGYFSLGEEYKVTVAYDNLTVELIGASDEWEWNSKIVNGRMYELPSTGGIGTEMYKISGLALMSGAALLLHKKKKDEEVQG